MKASIITLGCKLNQYDTVEMETVLERSGIEIVPFDNDNSRDADIFIINTCTVTQKTTHQARQLIRRAIKLKNIVYENTNLSKKTQVIVTGCYAQVAADELLRMIPEIDIIIGNTEKQKIIDFIKIEHRTQNTEHRNTEDIAECGVRSAECRDRTPCLSKSKIQNPKFPNNQQLTTNNIFQSTEHRTQNTEAVVSWQLTVDTEDNVKSSGRWSVVSGSSSLGSSDSSSLNNSSNSKNSKNSSLDPQPSALSTVVKLDKFGNQTRAYLKIQEGCNNKCAYCIVPFARGKNRSIKMYDVIEQAVTFAKNGYKEIVLTGVHITSYGEDIGLDNGLAVLLRELNNIDGIRRIRLSSMEPYNFTEELKSAIKELPKICKHLHIAFQSCDDEILEKMSRDGGVADYERLITDFLQSVPDIRIGADIIVGFPGEREENFENTYNFIKRMPISYLHIFVFSPRPGTAAWNMKNKVDSNTAKIRSRELQKLRNQKSAEFLKRYENSVLEALIEGQAKKSVVTSQPAVGSQQSIGQAQCPVPTFRATHHAPRPLTPHVLSLHCQPLAIGHQPSAIYSGLTHNYIRVLLQKYDGKVNELVPVKITKTGTNFVCGEIY